MPIWPSGPPSELSSCTTAKRPEPPFARLCALDYVRRSAECHPICLHDRWPQPLRLVCSISSWDPTVIATCWDLDGQGIQVLLWVSGLWRRQPSADSLRKLGCASHPLTLTEAVKPISSSSRSDRSR